MIEEFRGILILIPETWAMGAVLLLLVDLGAFAAQVAVLHGDVLQPLVIALLVGALFPLTAERRPGVRTSVHGSDIG